MSARLGEPPVGVDVVYVMNDPRSLVMRVERKQDGLRTRWFVPYIKGYVQASAFDDWKWVTEAEVLSLFGEVAK